MNTHHTILLSGILHLLIFVGARARAIPDFYTDDDLDAWHKFGLRSFYGPWGVIVRKSNGDFVSYADYGARIPTDFRSISIGATENDDDDDDDNDDDSSSGISHEDRHERIIDDDAAELTDFAETNGITSYGLASLANGLQISDTKIHGSHVDANEGKKNFVVAKSNNDFEELMKIFDGNVNNNDQSKRDTLELIGIVGVISNNQDSFENDFTTVSKVETALGTDDANDGINGSYRSIDVDS